MVKNSIKVLKIHIFQKNVEICIFLFIIDYVGIINQLINKKLPN